MITLCELSSMPSHQTADKRANGDVSYRDEYKEFVRKIRQQAYQEGSIDDLLPQGNEEPSSALELVRTLTGARAV